MILKQKINLPFADYLLELNMMLNMQKNKSLPVLVSIFLIIILNIFFLQNMILGIVCSVLYLSSYSYILGKNLFKSENKCFVWLLGFVFLLVLIIICGTIIYYTIGLFNWCIALILFMPLISIYILQKKHTCHSESLPCHPESLPCHPESLPCHPELVSGSNDKISKMPKQVRHDKRKKTKFLFFLDGIYFGLIISLFYILFINKTTNAIVSPWQVVPSHFFIIYFLSTCILLYKIFIYTEKFNLFLITLHTLLSSSIALIIYQIGYGFDPFIHRATEKIILNSGYILPKNPYYVGQYSLIVILTKIFNINLNIIDKILVPVLSSIIIPTLTYFSLVKINLEKKISQITSLIFPFFILFTIFFTVPQNLANIFLIIFIFLVLIYLKNNINNIIKLNHLWLLAIAITCIHPLAGIPALMTVWLLSIKNPVNPVKNMGHRTCKKIKILSILIFAISIPVIFYFLSFILPDFNISLDLSNLKTRLISDFSLNYLPFHSFLHSIYFLKILFPILIITLTLLGFWQLYKKQKHFKLFLIIAFILLVNSYLLSILKFDAVIYYEQNIFPTRLIHFAYFFILPFVLCAFSGCHLDPAEGGGKIPWKFTKYNFLIIISIAFITTSFLYLSYPTYDIIEKNKGYSISQSDIDAARKIQEISDTDNFVVLSNQSTSAAALQEFGFKKYYNNNFYYPIPTSSPLYKIYLDITYNSIKPEYIAQIKNITGADEVFLVFNDYWTNFKKLALNCQNTAKNSYNINNKIYIFEY